MSFVNNREIAPFHHVWMVLFLVNDILNLNDKIQLLIPSRIILFMECYKKNPSNIKC